MTCQFMMVIKKSEYLEKKPQCTWQLADKGFQHCTLAWRANVADSQNFVSQIQSSSIGHYINVQLSIFTYLSTVSEYNKINTI